MSGRLPRALGGRKVLVAALLLPLALAAALLVPTDLTILPGGSTSGQRWTMVGQREFAPGCWVARYRSTSGATMAAAGNGPVRATGSSGGAGSERFVTADIAGAPSGKSQHPVPASCPVLADLIALGMSPSMAHQLFGTMADG